MAFVAQRNGEQVAPPQVEDDARCVCPTCENELRVKRAHKRRNSFVARHFFHHVEEDPPSESYNLLLSTFSRPQRGRYLGHNA